MEINGQPIAGGIPASVDNVAFPNPLIPLGYNHLTLAPWSGNVMLVHAGVLKHNNVLRIRAGKSGVGDDIDNFVIDNVVVIFKTKPSPALPPELK